MQEKVIKKILPNGLVVLIHPVHHMPKVALNLWYGVGSKHEKSDEKGLAHLVEHMIFKGTKEKLSESDIDAVTTKLSGYTNAFTSYDYTCYVFDFPSSVWKEGLVLLSETMRNCRFDEQMLNSELSAVIQELKMYKDDYFDTLLSRLSGTIFADHPYHYPIIGFKQHLWNLQHHALVEFYRQHYIPNNAVLVIVGDVNADEAFEEAKKAFGHIPADHTYKKQEFYHSKDLMRHTITLYRDVQQPQAAISFVLPGARAKQRYVQEILACVLGKGKSSRLYAKIVDELELASELHASIDQREDATLLDISFQPNTAEHIDTIIEIIQQELQNITDKGVSAKELARAQKQVKASLYSVLESFDEQAGMIGESYLITDDENLIFKELEREVPDLDRMLQEIVRTYCHAQARHEGRILPMTPDMYEQADELQALSDEEDARIIKNRTRTSSVEPARYAHVVQPPALSRCTFIQPERHTLSNDLTILMGTRTIVPLIDIVLTLPAKEYDDPVDQQGLYRFVCDLLLEGTKNYPGTLLAQEIEGYGMTLGTEPGIITLTVLKEDLAKGLEFLSEILMHAEFDKKTVEKIRGHLIADLLVYWDEPQEFSNVLARQDLYKGHPYSKDPHGNIDAIKKITHTDLVAWYKKVCVPQGAYLALVGDLTGYNIKQEVERALGAWTGSFEKNSSTPALKPVKEKRLKHSINRDQVVLLFAGHSIPRVHPDYEKLLLFDQIFGGGAQGSMSSRLFKIREQTGLFYGVGGSLLVGCADEPGMVLVKTTVSLDRLQEAKDILQKTMEEVIDSLTHEELEQAKETIINGLLENVSTNRKVAGAFLGIARFNLPVDYFDTITHLIQAITLKEVQEAARRVLDPRKMITVEIGRV